MKDDFNLYKDISHLLQKCESCGGDNHLFKNCPFVGYIPNKDLIIRKHLFTQNQDRKSSSRRRHLRSVSALLIKHNLANLIAMGYTLDLQENEEDSLNGSGSFSNIGEAHEEEEGERRDNSFKEIELESPSAKKIPSPEKVQSSLLSRRGVIRPGALITKPEFTLRKNIEDAL